MSTATSCAADIAADMIAKTDPLRPRVLAELQRFSARGEDPTAQQLAYAVGHPFAAATVTAKLRDLRKPRYGSHRIDCYRCAGEERGTSKVYRYRYAGR